MISSRYFAFLATLSFAAFSQAQDLTQRVTFSSPAAPVSKILPKLAEAAHVGLFASPQTASEILVLRLQDAPLKDAMERIAKAAGAEWKKESAGFRLVRSSSLQTAQEKEERDLRAQRISKALAELNDKAAKLPKFDLAEAQRLARRVHSEIAAMDSGPRMRRSGQDNGIESPAGRAIISMLNAIGPQALASIPASTRAVFSTTPTRMQHSMPAQGVVAANEFVQMNKIYAEEYRKQQVDTNRQIMIAGGGMPETGNGEPALGMGKGLLVVTRMPFGDGLNCRLLVSDRNGETIGMGTLLVITPPAAMSSSPAAASDDAKPIVLSPVAQEFAKLIAAGAGGSGGMMQMVSFSSSAGPAAKPIILSSNPLGSLAERPSDALRAIALHPEDTDPLSLAPSEGLIGAATAKRSNLVACLPDSSLMPMSRGLMDGKADGDAVLGRIAQSADLKVATEDGWIVVSPSQPATARANRVNRIALGRLARALDASGTLRLDDLGAFAISQAKDISTTDLDGSMLRVVNAGAVNTAMSPFRSSTAMFRFYGLLTPAQKQVLGSGNPIAIGSLSPPQLAVVVNDVFNSQDGPQIQQPARDGKLTFSFGGMANSVKDERTEIMPDGLPKNGFLRVDIQRDDVAYGYDPKTGSSQLLDAPSLASQRYQKEAALPGFGSPVDYSSFLPAQMSSYTFRFELLPNVSLTRSLQDGIIDTSRKAAGFDSLPEAFRKQVEETLQNMRTAFGKAGAGG